jgi:anthranilate phosphoribosyltransferase
MASLDQPITRALSALTAGNDLGEELTRAAFGQLMRGEATAAQTAGLLMGLRVKGETAQEIAGAVAALRETMVRVPVNSGCTPIDTCGTGGGSVPTFNVSTAAALVAAAAGVPVAKHGNRSYTSKCGSADVVEALGLPSQLGPEAAGRVLAQRRMVFLFAPLYHPAMRFVAPVRKELGVPTIMNTLGPLANPAGVRRQVVGVADAVRGPLLAEALRRLGAEHALVVHGRVGMDEIAPWGPTMVWEVRDQRVREWTLDPEAFGASQRDLGRLSGGEPAHNAARVRRLLSDPRQDPVGRDTVLLNAGAALYVSGVAGSMAEGVERARSILEEGAAAAVLARLTDDGGLSTSA